MNKKVSVGLLISICSMVCAVTFTLTMFVSMGLFDSKMSSTKARESMYTKISEIDSYVRENYVGTIEDEYLMSQMLKGYVSGIGDEYARYYTVAEWQSVQTGFSGTVNGIGIKTKVDTTGYLRVVKVYDNTPAQEAGIEVGDLIIAVDDSDVLSIGAANANNLITGDPGTQVHIKYLRDNEEKEGDLVRRAVIIPSVEHRLVGNAGYITISEFGQNTAVQFEAALGQLINQNAASLVIDLRDNQGGLVSTCAKILDMLVGESDMIKAEYKNNVVDVLYDSDADKTELPITLVVNENTASSAELFCAVLVTEAGADVVGNTTYGKGVMQEYKQLSDGSGVDITIAYLMTSDNQKFDGEGIKPDYEITLTPPQAQQSYLFTVENDPYLLKAFEVAQSGSIQAGTNTPVTDNTTQDGGEDGDKTDDDKDDEKSDTAAFIFDFMYA